MVVKQKFSTSFPGAAKPRAIGPLHRADQRTDAGTPSTDQAHPRHDITGVSWNPRPAMLEIQEKAEGGTTEGPLRHLHSVPWKCIKEYHGAAKRISMTWSTSTAPSL